MIAAKSTSADGGDEEPKRRLERDEIGLKGSRLNFSLGPIVVAEVMSASIVWCPPKLEKRERCR